MLLFIYICKFICHGRHIMRVIVLFFFLRVIFEVTEWKCPSGLKVDCPHFFYVKCIFLRVNFLWYLFASAVLDWFQKRRRFLNRLFLLFIILIIHAVILLGVIKRWHTSGANMRHIPNRTPIKPLWNSVADYIGIFL